VKLKISWLVAWIDIFNAHKEQGVNKFLDERKNKITAEEAGQLVDLRNVLSPQRAYDVLVASQNELNNKIDEITFNRFFSKLLTVRPNSLPHIKWLMNIYDRKYFGKQIKNEIKVNELINDFEKNNYLQAYSTQFPRNNKRKVRARIKRNTQS